MQPQEHQEKTAFIRLRLIIAALVLAVAALCAICTYLWARADAAGPAVPTPEPVGTAAPRVSPTPGPTPAPAEHPAYEALYPELYAGEADRASVNEAKTVFLTFDDGPSARTPEVLAILRRYGVKATFFTVGQTDEASTGYMRQIVEEGHALGVHSYSHDYREIYAGVEEFLADFKAQYDLIYKATGTHPQIFRFPGGSINGYNGHVYQEIIAEMTRRGFVYFDWNVSGADATGSATAASVQEGATRNLGALRRAFVLMHDSTPRTYTVSALPAIIEAYQKEGFTFAALSPEVVPLIFPYKNGGLS